MDESVCHFSGGTKLSTFTITKQILALSDLFIYLLHIVFWRVSYWLIYVNTNIDSHSLIRQ